ncbi:hypothetical protein [Hyphomonas sp.]|jgi:hypothetical protein|uniref:hypothetical protein n=1 Tax=Hyphomonas sp. TaxID=87 RepID=UPI0025B826D7|nr:hypothetical protein [Hyphomonas sp.]
MDLNRRAFIAAAGGLPLITAASAQTPLKKSAFFQTRGDFLVEILADCVRKEFGVHAEWFRGDFRRVERFLARNRDQFGLIGCVVQPPPIISTGWPAYRLSTVDLCPQTEEIQMPFPVRKIRDSIQRLTGWSRIDV